MYFAFEFLFLFFTFLSFTLTTYSPPWTSSSMEFFSFLAVLSLFFSIEFKKQKISINHFFVFVIFLFIFSFFCFFNESINEIENKWMFFLYGIFLILVNNSAVLKKENFLIKTLFVVLFASFFNCFVIFSQYFNVLNSEVGIWVADYNASHGRPYGNFGQPNLAATFLLIGLCSCIFLYKRSVVSYWVLMLTAIFFGVALVFPASKTSMLCLIVLFLIACFLKDKLISIVFFVVFSLMVFIKSMLPSTRVLEEVDISTGRFEIWRTMLEALLQSPWLGYGVLNTKVAHFNYRELSTTSKNIVVGSSHNLFLDFLIWFGVFFGVIVSLYFVFILYSYFKRNIKKPEYLYLILPIVIHSQFEYPLFYANFLFLFVFFLNVDNSDLVTVIKGKYLPYFFALIGMSVFYMVSFEYLKVYKRFLDFRFYSQNYLNSKIPEPFNFIVLDITGGQYNSFLKNSIDSEQEFLKLTSLTKSMPSLKNYQLILGYLRKNKYPQEDIDFWMRKAQASFTEKELRTLEPEEKSRMP